MQSDSDDEAKNSTPRKSEFNGADVRFAQQMIPHHEQSIEMAQLALAGAGAVDRDTATVGVDKRRGEGQPGHRGGVVPQLAE